MAIGSPTGGRSHPTRRLWVGFSSLTISVTGDATGVAERLIIGVEDGLLVAGATAALK